MPPPIGPYDVSFQRIYRSLVSFVRSRLETDGAWKDFFEGSTGNVVIRLMSGLGAFINYRLEFIRRETYLGSAILRSSIYQIATFLGYPIRRRAPPIIEVDVFNGDSVAQSFDLFKNMGRLGNFPLAVIEPFSILPNKTKRVRLAVGTWKRSPTVVVTNRDVRDFVSLPFLDGNYSVPVIRDEFAQYLYVAGEQPDVILSSFPTVSNPNPDSVLLSDIAEDIFNQDKSVLLVETSYRGGLIARFGNGVLGFRITTGNIFFYFLETPGPVKGVATFQILPPDSSIAYSNVTLVSNGSLEDPLEKIKAVAPAYYSTLRRAVTAADHVAIFLNYSGSLVSAKVRKNDEAACCTLDMSYLFSDEHKATDEEKTAFQTYMDQYRMFGFQINFIDPYPIGVSIKVSIVLSPDAVSRQEVKDSIIDTLNEKSLLKLGKTFHVSEIISAILQVPGAMRAYLDTPWADKTADYKTYFRLEELVCEFISDTDVVERFVNDGCASPNMGYVIYSQPQIDVIQTP